MIPLIAESPTAHGAFVRLTDCISCEVTKSDSGDYSLRLQYPVNGAFAEKIVLQNQINAITSRADTDTQPFVISKIEQDISGLITVTAYHATYALANYPVRPFDETEMTPQEALTALSVNSPVSIASGSLYVASADWSEKRPFGLSKATNWREALYGRKGMLEVFGGNIVVDGRTVTWKQKSAVGSRKGMIRYGSNLVKFNRVYDISDTYSHAYVYWKNDEETVECPGLVQLGTSDVLVNSTILNMSEYFEEAPTTDELAAKAKEIAEQDSLTDVETKIDISFVPLRLTDEYKHMTWLEEVDLFDSVTVEIPMYGSNVYARVTKTRFDVLDESYKSISVGTPQKGLDATLARLI